MPPPARRSIPSRHLRYPFHVQRLENLDIPTFPLINLWEGEDDQVPSLKATADELGFRTPIIGNLFRDGGEALAPQLDGFVDAPLQNGSMPAEPHSHKGMALTENAKWVAENAGGVPVVERVICRASPSPCPEAMELRQSAGISLDDLAFVAVNLGDHDRQRPCPRRRAHRDPEEGRGACRCRSGPRQPDHQPHHPHAQDRVMTGMR